MDEGWMEDGWRMDGGWMEDGWRKDGWSMDGGCNYSDTPGPSIYPNMIYQPSPQSSVYESIGRNLRWKLAEFQFKQELGNPLNFRDKMLEPVYTFYYRVTQKPEFRRKMPSHHPSIHQLNRPLSDKPTIVG